MAHAQRTANVVHHLNPVPYRGSFFGEKLHLDQNEKLCMYGIVHILAVDGYSRKIVGFITIPKKNPIEYTGICFTLSSEFMAFGNK